MALAGVREAVTCTAHMLCRSWTAKCGRWWWWWGGTQKKRLISRKYPRWGKLTNYFPTCQLKFIIKSQPDVTNSMLEFIVSYVPSPCNQLRFEHATGATWTVNEFQNEQPREANGGDGVLKSQSPSTKALEIIDKVCKNINAGDTRREC